MKKALLKTNPSKFFLYGLVVVLFLSASAVIFLLFFETAWSHNLNGRKMEFELSASEFKLSAARPNYFLGVNTPASYFRSELADIAATSAPVPLQPVPAKIFFPLKGSLTAPILMYHYIALAPTNANLPHLYTSPKIFEQQLAAIYNAGYETVLISDIGEALAGRRILPAKPLALTFDDGYEDFYTTVVPLLRQYGLKGTAYIIVDAVDKPGYLTKKQLAELAQNPNIEIASHSINHANLKEITDSQAKIEIKDSKKQLEKIIGRPVKDFAYPFGAFLAQDKKFCREAGYLTCASTLSGVEQTYAERFSLYRIRPMSKIGADLLKLINTAEY